MPAYFPAGRRARLAPGNLSGGSQRVQPATWTVFTRCNFGLLAPAAKQAHLFEPLQRAVERAVCGEEAPIRVVRDLFRQFVAMEFLDAAAPQQRRAGANRLLEGQQRSRLPSHRDNYRQIYAYYVKLSKRPAAADIPNVVRPRVALLALALTSGACVDAEPTACDGFADRKLAIGAQEYRACATEIMDALDALEKPLRAIVANKASSDQRDECRRAYEKLRLRIRRTGIEDDYRSMRPGTVIVKWSNGSVSSFNSAAFQALVQYGAVRAYPNSDNFAQGVRAHEEARRHYRAIR